MTKEEQVELAHDVGMVNPFALYDIMKNTQTPWAKLMETREGRVKVKMMFELAFDFEFCKLWDPKNRSPLYTWTQSELDKTVTHMELE